jgi:hypothetical protein
MVSKLPDMSRLKWRPAQVEHREKMRQAFVYARAAARDPELRTYCLKMARRKKKNNRPYDMAVSDYCQGSDLFRKRALQGHGCP